MPDVTFRAYSRTARATKAATIVHGRYDALVSAPVRHPYAQLFLPLAGRIHVAPEGQSPRVLGPEEALWLPAGLPHAASSLGAVVEFVALNVPPTWLRATAAANGLPEPAAGLLVLRDPALWHAGRVLALSLSDPPGGETFLAGATTQLGLLALGVAQRSVPAPEGAAETGVLRAVDRVFRDYATELTVEDLAHEAGLGVRQLERRFHAVIGSPPRKFLIAVRLAAARERLLASSESVGAIAEAVGFADSTHFVRAFRAAMGQTPAVWRRTIQTERG